MSEWWKEDHDELSELPAHARRVIRDNGITTVEQLKASNPLELLRMAGFGRVSLQQVKDFLNKGEVQ